MKFAIVALMAVIKGKSAEWPPDFEKTHNVNSWPYNARNDDGTDDDKVLSQRSLVSIGEKLEMLGMTQHKPRRIVDEDGDGVEDNVEKTRDELDRFYIPAVFGPAEEMHNTHHGNMPGHTRLEEFEEAPEYNDPWVGLGKLDHYSAMNIHF